MIKNENIGEEKIMKTRLTKSEFAVMEVERERMERQLYTSDYK